MARRRWYLRAAESESCRARATRFAIRPRRPCGSWLSRSHPPAATGSTNSSRFSRDSGLGTSRLKLFPPHHARSSQRPTQPRSHAAPELHVQEPFHLPPETLAITVPPDLLHSRHAVSIEILHAHHFIQAKAPVGAPHPAGFDAPMRSLADAKARDHIVDHDRTGMDAACQPLAPFRIAGPDAGRQARSE